MQWITFGEIAFSSEYSIERYLSELLYLYIYRMKKVEKDVRFFIIASTNA